MATRIHAGDDEPLFATIAGKHVDRTALGKMIKTCAKRAGVLNAYPHRFRHTYAITFLRNGGSPLALQDILGHSSLETVRLYVHLAEVDIKADQAKASPADSWGL